MSSKLRLVLTSLILLFIILLFVYWLRTQQRKVGRRRRRHFDADVIIIGLGTSGSILANRLSEKFSVLAIEAGSVAATGDVAIQAVGLPALNLPETDPEKYFWPGFQQSVPQTGLNGRTVDWTTGMIAGGESSVNDLYYERGSNAGYSTWDGIVNNSHWSLTNILTTFNALENYAGLTIGARGTAGPVHVLQTPTVAPMTSAQILPSLMSALPGIPITSDYNSPGVENAIDIRAQWFINSTKRESSATAFPLPRKVIANSTVVKIEFDRRQRAKSVSYLQNNHLHKVSARKAIILSAGINSSKLLQLSGIGSKSLLSSLNIPVVYNNPAVGQHLQTHPYFSISLLANASDNGVPPGADYAYTIANAYLPLTGGTSTDPRAFQILFDYLPNGTSATPIPLLVLKCMFLTPKSEGSVNIQSANPFKIAAADPAIYTDPSDLAEMKKTVQGYIRSILDQLALANAPPFYRPILTDPINTVQLSGYADNVVEAYLANNTHASGFSGHTRMGSVVDGNLLVTGTKNLYVAGAEVSPVLPDNVTSASMMMGFIASDILKNTI